MENNAPNGTKTCESMCQRTCAILSQSCSIQSIASFDHDRYKIKKKKNISVITRFFVFRDATIGCYCEDGYARNTNHICIPIKD